MRTLLFLVLLFALPFAASSESRPAPPPIGEEEGKILALEKAWNQAEQSKDAHALDQILDATLVYVDYDGSLMNKSEFLASVQAPSLHTEQIINEGMSAQVYGNAAVVNGTYRDKGTENGKPYFRRGRFTDTWIKRNGAWTCVASQSTLISRK
jgi:ketosteroid isomerase-like protein